jgi:hypothetical protein
MGEKSNVWWSFCFKGFFPEFVWNSGNFPGLLPDILMSAYDFEQN